MAFGNFYNAGLASTDTDPRKIIGNGTLWGTGNGNIRPGDTFEAGGVRVTIYSVDEDEELTLLYDWPGSALSDDPYVIRQDSPARLKQIEAAQGIADLLSALRIRQNAAWVFAVEDFGVNTPPTDYAYEEMLVIGTSPAGGSDFAGRQNMLATKTVHGWSYDAPGAGWITVDKSVTPYVARTWDATAAAWVVTGSLLGAPVWNGPWSSSTSYTTGALVTYLNRVWVAGRANSNKPPNANPLDWTEWLAAGENGGAVSLTYTFKTSTTATVANTAGQMNMSAAPGSATVLRLNKTDAFGNDWTTLFTGLGAGGTTRLGRVRIIVVGDETRQWQANVTAVVSASSGARFEFTLESGSVELGSNSFADGNTVLFLWSDAGAAGVQGDAGPAGIRGPIGGPISIPYVFSELTADANPAAGNLRLDNASQEDALTLRVSNTDSSGTARNGLFNSIPVIGTGAVKAMGSLYLASAPEANWLNFKITDEATLSGYRNLTIEVIDASSASPFADGDAITLAWLPLMEGDAGPAGPQGDQGVSFTPQRVVATLDLREDFDNEDEGTSVLVESDIDNDGKPTLYFLITPGTPGTGVWSEGFEFTPGSAAVNSSYDNSSSGLAATNVQAAIDEVVTAFGGGAQEEDVSLTAGTAAIGASSSSRVRVTGSGAVTSFSSDANKLRYVRFDGPTSITQGSSLELQGSASRQLSAGDSGIYASDSAGKWKELDFSPVAGPGHLAQLATKAAAVAAITQLPPAFILLTGYDTANDGLGGLFENVSAPDLGPELVTTGDFSSSTGWSLGAGIAISGGVLSWSSTTTSASQTTIPIEPSVLYRVAFDLTAYTAGQVRARFANAGNTAQANGTLRSAVASYVEYITNLADGTVFRFSPGGTTTCSVDNASVKRVLKDAFQIADGTWFQRVTRALQNETKREQTVYPVANLININFEQGSIVTCTLTQNISTIVLNGMPSGGTMEMLLIQDAAGSRTVAWPSGWLWNGGGDPPVSSTANAVSRIAVSRRGSIYCADFIGQDYS